VFAKDLTPLSFNVPPGLTQFTAKVALDRNTVPGFTAHVGIKRGDGTTLADVTVSGREVQDVTESLAGTGVITVEVEITQWAPDAVNNRPHVVLGDGRFLK
jgi:hypothetical protein